MTAADDGSAAPTPVEKPPHVDPDRMRHISLAGLLAAADGAGAADLAGLRRHFAERPGPRPVWDPARWAAGAGDAERAETLAAADELVELQVDFTDASRGRSVFYGFHYLGWMTPLVRAYALGGDPRHAAAFGRLIGEWHAVRDEVVGDWPGLDVIWYSLGITARSSLLLGALAVLSGEPALADGQWAQMLASVVGGARWSAEEHDEFRHGNWQLACCAELLHAGAMLPEFRESAGWIAVARERLVDHLERDVYADGGHYERSPGYHTMCLNAYHRAAVIGEQLLGWPLAEHPRFRAMHDWLLGIADPSGYAMPFQDSGLIWPGAELLKGHYFCGDPAYKAMAQRWLSPERIAHELAVLPPRPARGRTAAEEFAAAPAAEPPAGSSLLASSRYAVMRTGWGPDDVTAVVNYGPYVGHELEPHSHHAALDFVITGWGEPLAWEAGGPPSYDDPGYYDWFQATRGHNTVVLPGQDFTEDRDARLIAFRATEHLDVFVGEHHGYDQPHRRRIVFSRTEPRYWLITDEVDGDGPAQWLLHGRTPWTPAPSGAGYVSAEGPGLAAIPVAPGQVESVALSSGPSRIPTHQRSARPRSAFGPVTAGGNGFGEVHTLSLEFARGAPFSVLLVPFSAADRDRFHAGEPPVRVSSADDVVEVAATGTLDRVGQRHWQRSGAAASDPLVVSWEDSR